MPGMETPLTGLTGDCLMLGAGSWLENEEGLEMSLWLSSRLEGRYALVAELLSDGGPVRQNIVIPSVG
jgi:hypothetical protein